MRTDEDSDLLTIAEAATLLKVSRITLRRWLKQGRLRAYHVGPKALRIRRGDLAAVMTPTIREEVTAMKEVESAPVLTDVRALTAEEKRRGLDALRGSEALLARLLAQRGAEPLTESWPVIREAREARSAQQR